MSDPAPFDSPLFLALLILLAAPAVGSFLGLVADRLPRGESVVAPRSFCRACGAGLGWRELLPVLSYLLQGGRCRRCGARLGRWHLWAELAALAAAGLAVAAGGGAPAIGLSAALLWLLLALVLCDLRWFRLPDALTGLLLALALGLALARFPVLPGGPGPALAGAGLGAGGFWALRAGYRRWRGRQGMGLGDVKLMAGLGALVGPWALPQMLLLAALGALAVAAWQARRRRGALRGDRPLPFGAALCLAGAAIWLAARFGLVGHGFGDEFGHGFH